MADAVTSTTIIDGPKHTVLHLTSISDGTGESAVIKANISELQDLTNAGEGAHFAIERIEYNIIGFTDVRLLWDATTDIIAAILPPSEGVIDYRYMGGLVDQADGDAGHTGDIVLTTTGALSGDTYDIRLFLKKKQA